MQQPTTPRRPRGRPRKAIKSVSLRQVIRIPETDAETWPAALALVAEDYDGNASKAIRETMYAAAEAKRARIAAELARLPEAA